MRTGIVHGGGRFPLISLASSSKLTGLLNSSRSSSRLARSLGSSGDRRLARGGRISRGLSGLAELLQVLLDGAGSAVDFISTKLQRC